MEADFLIPPVIRKIFIQIGVIPVGNLGFVWDICIKGLGGIYAVLRVLGILIRTKTSEFLEVQIS